MRTTSLSLLVVLSAFACNPPSKTDLDGDGIAADVDCNDLDESIGAPRAWVADGDGDGWGGEGAETKTQCDRPTEGNWAIRVGDCDDGDPGISPGAEETCNGVDDDCDGFEDENTDKGVWFADVDGDGFGDPDSATEACDGTGGYVSNSLDCDDSLAEVKPGAEEICDGIDNDCDARIDEADAVDAKSWFLDVDSDGYGQTRTEIVSCDAPSEKWSDAGNDCNDDEPSINPGVEERCDGFDNNCDGQVDGADATDALTWYADDDGDTYGDDSSTVKACFEPDGFISRGGDCDDRNRFLSPETLWYADDDGDNYGTPDDTIASCTDPSSGAAVYVDNARDCNDADSSINPLGAEVCNGIDDDCDGTADGGDASDATTYYMDFDGDGFGDPGRTGRACARPDGFTTDSSDCDDDNKEVYPGAIEFCDTLDNDCDGLIDYADPDVKVLTWYLDADEDDFGQTSVTKEACEKPAGYVAADGDCDDADPDVNPAAEEVCDAGLDNNCNGLADKDDPTWTGKDGTWYRDADGDTKGDEDISVVTCTDVRPSYVRNDDDCDDTDASKWNTCWAGIRNFTTCRATGQNGPTTCTSEYSGTTLEGEVTVTAGKQKWTVPQDGTYRIEAWGAQGHSADTAWDGGKGARIRGDYELSEGDVLVIAVGQEGLGDGCSGGGGGGSWVVTEGGDPLIIAGGGSGTRSVVSQDGCDGRTTEYGGTASGSGTTWGCGAKSSDLGVGGIVSSSSWGSAGGGLKSDGGYEYTADNAGKSWSNGLRGGGNSSYNAYGGFGAAGAGNGSCGGGGGGGYSGGDGGRVAGGGGSFNDGADVSNSANVQTGAGKVTIDWIGK